MKVLQNNNAFSKAYFHRVGKLLFLSLLLPLTLNVNAQSWEQVKVSPDYLIGEGTASTLEEADKMALADLASRISVSVSNQWDSHELEQNINGNVDSKTVMSSLISSYSSATISNTEKIILSHEPNAHVGRYIRKSELSKLFEQRRDKIAEYVDGAERAVEKGKIDEAMRQYYWALALTKSMQYPNKEKYNGHVLTSWLIEQMNDVMNDIRISVIAREDDHADLAFMYKGKPVNSLDFTYYDSGWSNICSALDGRGSIDIDPSDEAQSFQIRIEYKYENQASLDPEVKAVMKLMKSKDLPKAVMTVKCPSSVATAVAAASSATAQAAAQAAAAAQIEGAPVAPTEAEMDVTNPQNTFTEVRPHNYKPVKQMEADDAAPYLSVVSKVEKAIRSKNYASAKEYFTGNGWSVFRRLVQYGRGRMSGTPQYNFTQLDDEVFVRGMQMNFSFAHGARRNFMEDVVFTMNSECLIDNVTFGLGKTAENDILTRGAWPERTRLVIQNFMENYKTAYALKRLDYLRNIFDKHALIIVGNVVKQPTGRLADQNKRFTDNNEIIKYNQYTKEEFMAKLQKSFDSKEYINLRFNDNIIKKASKGGEIYGIELSQDYYSNNYSDHGYLFLMVDMNDPQNPLIKVRTWQPERDPQFGVYSLDDFPIR
ncbi:MAG: hypothetical protein K6F94_05080 [Bacteroidaceae bacterium]|nr:hypothetical protein [Bacteroidaceae bacterium]